MFASITVLFNLCVYLFFFSSSGGMAWSVTVIMAYHRSLKFSPYITSIAPKPKAHNAICIVSFWFGGYGSICIVSFWFGGYGSIGIASFWYGGRLAPVSNVNFFSKTDNLSKIEIYKLYLEVEVLGLDIRKFDYQRG